MLRRKTTFRYFQMTVDALNECDIIFKKNLRIGHTPVGGWYLNDTVAINDAPDTDNLILNLIHEAWHHLRPTWKEGHIDKWSRKLFCEFSTNDLKNLEKFLRRK